MNHRTAGFLLAALALAATAPPAKAAAPLDTRALDAALSKYWSRRQDKAPLIDGLYTHKGRHELTVYTGVLPNDNFYSYVPLGLRWNYFIGEELGLEVAGDYLLALDGDLKTFLTDKKLYKTFDQTPRRLVWNATAALIWSPLHGKLAIFTEKLLHFDLQASLGAGALGTDADGLGEVHFAGTFGLAARMYASEALTVRLDYRQLVYPGVSGVAFPAEVTLGVSFWLP